MVVRAVQLLVRTGVRAVEQGRVRHQRHPGLGAQVAEDRPVRDADLAVVRETGVGDIGPHAQIRVVVLQHVGPRAPGGGRKAPCPLHLPGPVVAQAEQADQAVADKLPERGDLLVQRNPGLIRDVRVVEIDPLHAEAFPAALAGFPDRRAGQAFARGVEAGRRRERPCADLRGNDDLVTDTAAGTPPAEQRLTLAALRAVHIEQVVV